MSNVLPKETLQVEWSRFRNRAMFVGALVLLGTAILSGLMLLPAHVALQVEQNTAAQKSTESSGEAPVVKSQTGGERSDIVRAQALLDSVGPIVFATSSPSTAIAAALALRPASVRVLHITFASGNTSTITLEGTSPGRESINEYKEALVKSGRFKNVSVPVGALVGTEGGKFTITLMGILK